MFIILSRKKEMKKSLANGIYKCGNGNKKEMFYFFLMCRNTKKNNSSSVHISQRYFLLYTMYNLVYVGLKRH
jgi:hypothetical protein